MTREEADMLLEEWRSFVCPNDRSWANTLHAAAIKVRIIDAMTGEEPTQPLAGNAR